MFKGLPFFNRREDAPEPRPAVGGDGLDDAVNALFEARMTAIRALVLARRATNLASAAREDSASRAATYRAWADEDGVVLRMLEG